MKVGSLFSGVGGFDLAASWMGWTTVWYSEIQPYRGAIMAHHFPTARALGDIEAIEWSTVEPVDLVCGGFPCQDISAAGSRRGIAGARSGLWREFVRCLCALRPRFAVVENSPDLRVRGFDVVLGDLADLGFDAEWRVLSAADVGAHHRRRRLWITATRRPDMADADGGRRETRGESEPQGVAGQRGAESDRCRLDAIKLDPARWPRSWHVEPALVRVANGVPDAVDRVTALGNAVVPACAYHIFRRLDAIRRGT